MPFIGDGIRALMKVLKVLPSVFKSVSVFVVRSRRGLGSVITGQSSGPHGQRSGISPAAGARLLKQRYI